MPGAWAALKTVVTELSVKNLCPVFALAALIAGFYCADAHAAVKEHWLNGLSFGIRNGYVGLTHSNGFQARYGNTTYKTDSNKTGIYPFLRYGTTEKNAIEIEYGKESGGGPTLQTVALSGLQLLDYEMKKVRPYLRIGAVLGRVKWPDQPGTFLTGMGWLAGAGAVREHGRIIYTADILYRSLRNPYVKGVGGSGESDEINLSGLSLRIGASIKY